MATACAVELPFVNGSRLVFVARQPGVEEKGLRLADL